MSHQALKPSQTSCWTILFLNLLAVVVLQFLAAFATQVQRTHAYSTYRELVINHALVENPTYTDGTPLDVEKRLRVIGAGGYDDALHANIASAACLFTGLVFFFSHKPRRHEKVV